MEIYYYTIITWVRIAWLVVTKEEVIRKGKVFRSVNTKWTWRFHVHEAQIASRELRKQAKRNKTGNTRKHFFSIIVSVLY